MSSGGIHVVPSFTLMSAAVSGSGWTRSSICTLTAKSGSLCAARRAISSLARTLPERYSSAGCHSCVCGSRKICCRSAVVICSCGIPSSSADIYAKSILPRSASDSPSASSGVSACVATICGLIVRLLKMAVLPITFCSSSSFSSASSSGYPASFRKASLLPRL